EPLEEREIAALGERRGVDLDAEVAEPRPFDRVLEAVLRHGVAAEQLADDSDRLLDLQPGELDLHADAADRAGLAVEVRRHRIARGLHRRARTCRSDTGPERVRSSHGACTEGSLGRDPTRAGS